MGPGPRAQLRTRPGRQWNVRKPLGQIERRATPSVSRASPAPISRRLLHRVTLSLIIGATVIRLATTALPRIGLRWRLGLPEEAKTFAAPGAAFRDVGRRRLARDEAALR